MLTTFSGTVCGQLRQVLLYMLFWKWVLSNHDGPTATTRKCGRASHVFSRPISVLVLIFCDFVVGASIFVVRALQPLVFHWLRDWVEYIEGARTLDGTSQFFERYSSSEGACLLTRRNVYLASFGQRARRNATDVLREWTNPSCLICEFSEIVYRVVCYQAARRVVFRL
jgi:hypothetical protein